MTHKLKTMLLGPETKNASLRVEVFVLCETAQEFGGRLNLLGTFENIQSATVPVVFPALTVAIRLRFWPDEVGAHHCGLRLVDPDGHLVMPELETDFIVQPAGNNQSVIFNLIVHLQNVLFECGGEHSLDFYLDGEIEAGLPLQLDVKEHAA